MEQSAPPPGIQNQDDPICLDEFRTPSDPTPRYWTQINSWLDWMTRVTNEDLDTEVQEELYVMDHLLRNFLGKRLQWIQGVIKQESLRQHYLLVLPPFNQRSSVKGFLLHFFKFTASQANGDIQFDSLSRSERELRILWDIYKLIKSIETIDVLKNSLSGPTPFPSQFSAEHIQATLVTMSQMLNLLIQICVKPEHYNNIRYYFTPELFQPDAILNRRKSGNFFINQITLDKFNYRNYLFHIFFKSSLRSVYKGHKLTFKYNLLDFEIMRRELLIHWMTQRLAGNPGKKEALNTYLLDQQKLGDLTKNDPDLEPTLLAQLPGYLFEDIMAQVNDRVELELKSPIEPISETAGEYARRYQIFEKAKKLAQDVASEDLEGRGIV